MFTRVPSVDAAATKLIDAPSFSVPVAEFIKHEIEKKSVDKSKMEKRFVKLAKAFEEQKIKIEDEIPT